MSHNLCFLYCCLLQLPHSRYTLRALTLFHLTLHALSSPIYIQSFHPLHIVSPITKPCTQSHPVSLLTVLSYHKLDTMWSPVTHLPRHPQLILSPNSLQTTSLHSASFTNSMYCLTIPYTPSTTYCSAPRQPHGSNYCYLWTLQLAQLSRICDFSSLRSNSLLHPFLEYSFQIHSHNICVYVCG